VELYLQGLQHITCIAKMKACKTSQVYLYSTYFTQWQIKVLYRKEFKKSQYKSNES